MNFSPTYAAILLLVAGNLLASLSDVAVKLVGGEVATFQYVFIRQLLSTLVIFPLWWFQPSSLRPLEKVALNTFRAHLIIVGSGCMVVAISHLTLATANAVFYAAPLLMLPLSVLLLGEKPHIKTILATGFGFIGVLVVLRPDEFHWAAFFALGTSITLALFNLTARRLPKRQTTISTLFWTSVLSLPVSAILAFLSWQEITWYQVALILISAGLILMYNGLAVIAYRKAPANQIALAENSGLVFVVILGISLFNEIPSVLTLIGILMIVAPLLPWRVIIKRSNFYGLLRPKPPLDKRKNITD